MMTGSCLYLGQVMHHRLSPVGHRFTYRVASLLLDIDEMPEPGLRLFSRNRFNLFSVNDADLGEGGTPRAWIDALLSRHGIAHSGGKVAVHLFPRVLGFGFTPLATWFCHDSDGTLQAILYEVHNTFGERHAYLIRTGQDSRRTLHHHAGKAFHVSPFIGPNGNYAFSVRPPGDRFSLSIRETDATTGAPILVASHVARRVPLTDRHLLRAALSYSLLPFQILGGIHWEAFRLWRKGAPFHKKPPPPAAFVSFANNGGPQ